MLFVWLHLFEVCFLFVTEVSKSKRLECVVCVCRRAYGVPSVSKVRKSACTFTIVRALLRTVRALLQCMPIGTFETNGMVYGCQCV